MSEVLSLQDEEPEVPGEDKASHISVLACRESHWSVAVCHR
jgi:hypothetical protein